MAGLASIFVLLLVLVLSSSVTTRLAGLAGDKLSEITGLNISIRNVDIPLFGKTLRLHDVLLGGADGRPWFAVDQVEIDIDSGEITRGKLHIPEVRIKGVQGGVMVVGDDVWPIDGLSRVIKRLSDAGSGDVSDGGFVVSIGPIIYSGTKGYFLMDDPPMFVSVPPFSGKITLDGDLIHIMSEMPAFTYTLFDWPFQIRSLTAATTIHGDRIKVAGRVVLDDGITDIATNLSVNADTGDVQLYGRGFAQSGLVNRYFSDYPTLQGAARLEFGLAVTDSFSLAATARAPALNIQRDLALKNVVARIHMTDEQIWIDQARGSYTDGGFFDLGGTLPFWPQVSLAIAGRTVGAPLRDLVSNFAGDLEDIVVSGKYDGDISASVDVGHAGVLVTGQIHGRIRDGQFVLAGSSVDLGDATSIASVVVNVEPGAEVEVGIEVKKLQGKEFSTQGDIQVKGKGVAGNMRANVRGKTLRQLLGKSVLDDGSVNLVVTGRSPEFLIQIDARNMRSLWYNEPLVVAGKIITSRDTISTDGLRIFSESGMFVGGEVTYFLDQDQWYLRLDGNDIQLSRIGNKGWDGVIKGNISGSWDARENEFYPAQISLYADQISTPVWQGQQIGLTLKDSHISGNVGRGSIAGMYHNENGYHLDLTAVNVPLRSGRTMQGVLGAELSLSMTTMATLRTSGSIRIDDLILKGRNLGSAVGGFKAELPDLSITNADWTGSLSLFGAENTVSVAADHDQDRTLLWAYADAPHLGDLIDNWPSGDVLDVAGNGLLVWKNLLLTDGMFRLDRVSASYKKHLISLVRSDDLRVENGVIRANNLDVDLAGLDGKKYHQSLALRVDRQWRWRLAGDVNLPLSLTRIVLPFLRFSGGTVQGHLSVSGRDTGPEWQGDLSVTPGQLAFSDLGLRQEIKGGQIRMHGSRWQLNQIELADESGGTTILSGNLFWKGWDLEGDLEFEIENSQISPSEGFVARLSGRLGLLLGRDQPIRIQGELNLDEAMYTRRFDWELALLKFQKRDLSRLNEIAGSVVLLDILIRNDRRLRIRNNLADTLVDGNMRLTGSVSKPSITGNLQTIGGTLFWRGVAYTVRNALFQFVDPREINPVIDLEALAIVPYYDPEAFGSTARQDYEISFKAFGPLRSLQMQFASTPELSQVDILSLLNFGVLADRLSGGAGGTSQIELTNLVLGAQIARFEEEIEDLIGFDRFELRPAFNRGSQSSTIEVAIEKRIGKRLRLRLASSVDQIGEQRFGMDYSLSDFVNVSLGWDNQTDVQIGNFSIQPSLRFPLP